MAKGWCSFQGDPLVKQVAEKYNISKKDARTVINNAKQNNPSLQSNTVTLNYLESQDSFKQAMAVYVQKYVDTEDVLFSTLPGEREDMQSFTEDVREQLSIRVDDDALEDKMEMLNEMRAHVRLASSNAKEIAAVLAAFSDSRRLGFIGDWICKNISELLTDISTNPEMRAEHGIREHQSRRDYLLDNTVQQVIDDYILSDLEDHMKELKSSNPQLAAELKAAIDNYETIIKMYGSQLFRDERVCYGSFGKELAETEDESQLNDGDPDDENDEDNNDKSKNSFSANDQNMSVTTKILPGIKVMLSNIRRVNGKGKEITDQFGYGLHTYASVPTLINSILKLCKGCHSIDEMIVRLKRNAQSTPELQQIIRALDLDSEFDASGWNKMSKSQKEQLRTQFFQSFRKEFTIFRTTYMTYDANGNMIFLNRDHNSRTTTEMLMSKVYSHFRKMAGSDIFVNGSISFERIKALKKNRLSFPRTAQSPEFNKLNIPLLINEAKRNVPRTDMKSSDTSVYSIALQKLSDAEEQVKGVLKSIGIDVSNKTLNAYLSNISSRSNEKQVGDPDSMHNKFWNRVNRLEALCKNITMLINKFEAWEQYQKINKDTTHDTPATNPFTRRKDKASDYPEISHIRNWYEHIINDLTEFDEESMESMVRINGKSYYSWNLPSSIGTIIEKLKKVGSVRDYIRKKYTADSLWYVSRVDEDGTPHFYSDMLEELYNGTGTDILQYSEKPSFCGKDYYHMSDANYALSMFCDYFLKPFGVNMENTAWYRVLIAGDKPRFATIRWRKYSIDSMTDENSYQNVAGRQALKFFTQEMKRAADVIAYAAKGTGSRIENYDIDPSKHKALFAKIKAGTKITVDDVLDEHGLYTFRASGAAFFLNPFINEEIEKKTRLGKIVVDYIFNGIPIAVSIIGEKDEDGKALNKQKVADMFKKAFHSYMDNMLEENMKYYENIGLFSQKRNNDGTIHMEYLAGVLRQWHEDEDERSYNTRVYGANLNAIAEEQGVNLDTERQYKPYLAEMQEFRHDLKEYIYNNWMAKANMSQVFDVDFAFYGNTTNFQKRNAQIISSGYPIDRDASIHEKKVCPDGKFRSITLKTIMEKSKYADSIRENAYKLMETITDRRQRKQAKRAVDAVMKELVDKGFDPTDGQGLTCLSALRKRLAGQGEWSRSDSENLDERGFIERNGKPEYIFTDEAIYRRALRHEILPEDLMHVFAQPQKPFVYAFMNMPRKNRGTITVPIQHKNSEYMMAYLQTAFSSAEPKSIAEAIAKFMEESARRNPGRGIDTVNFDSCVKIGNTSDMIDLTGLSPQEVLQKLRDSVYKGKSNDYKPGVVTEYDVEDYKIVQQKPEHFKNAFQPMGSQMKILAISNIKDTEICTLPNGKQITGKELKRRYFKALGKKMQQEEADFRKQMGLNLPQQRRIFKFSNRIKNALSTDQKFTSEMRRGLSVTERNGERQFILPMDEVGVQPSIEAMVLSKIRKIYYREKTRGGIVVQVTSWGESEDLHIRFYSSDPNDKDGLCKTLDEFKAAYGESTDVEKRYIDYLKKYSNGFAYFETELPMPDHIRKRLLGKNGKVDKTYFNEDGSWNMDKIKEVIPESMFDCISYRLPTQSKSFMMRGKITRFSPEAGGSRARYPKELTVFTDSDFDIDTNTVEIRPEPGAKNEQIDNELFDLHMAALQSGSGTLETFRLGDFSDLKDLSYFTYLLRAGYSVGELRKMSPKEWKSRCMQVENMDLLNPKTDIILHNQNSDAKEMISIAAVSVASHAFFSIYNDVDESNPKRNPKTNPQNFLRIFFKRGDGKTRNEGFRVVNDSDPNDITEKDVFTDEDSSNDENARNIVILDPSYDMDGTLISTELSKYVGASADAAKDAAEYRLNINKQTLPILVLMHRLGISSTVAREFISQPVFRMLVQELNNASSFSYASISDACDAVRERIMGEELQKKGLYFETEENSKDRRAIIDRLNRELEEAERDTTIELRYSSLLKSKEDPDSQSTMDKFRLLHVFEVLSEKSKKIRNLDGFVRYNSSKTMSGSTYIQRFCKRKSIDTLHRNLCSDNPVIKLPQDVAVMDEFEQSEFGRLCSMFPYIGRTINGEAEMEDKLLLDNMKTYSSAFFEALDRLTGGRDLADESLASIMKTLYDGWKSYLLFMSDKRIADFRDPKIAHYYTRGFARAWDARLEKIKTEHPDIYEKVIENNSFVSSVTYEESKDGYDMFEMLTTMVTNMSTTSAEFYKKDWESLLAYPETKQLAIDCAIHFLARAAAFSRSTPVHLMPLAVKEAIPNYISAFAEADKVSMNDMDMEYFITLFCLNNSGNELIVPQFYEGKDPENPRAKYFASKEDENSGIVRIKSSSAALQWNITGNQEAGYKFKSPVLCVDGQPYLVTNDEVQIQAVGRTQYIVLEVVKADALGIPNQISEYTDFSSGSSLFRRGENETKIKDRRIPKDPDYNPATPIAEQTTLVKTYDKLMMGGSRIGTYLDAEPLGHIPADAEEQSRDIFERKNKFIETRTFLKRLRRITDFMGMKLGQVTRSQSGEYAVQNINIKPTLFDQDQHTVTTQIAAMMRGLDIFKSKDPTIVRTYVSDVNEANAVELSLPLTPDRLSESGRDNFNTFREKLGNKVISAEIDIDAKELRITLNNDIKAVKAVMPTLKKLLDKNEVFEVNYMKLDVIDDEQATNILNEIKDEIAATEPGIDAESSTVSEREQGVQTGVEVGLGNIVDTALFRLTGNDEKVAQSRIRDLFGEVRAPLMRTSESAVSFDIANDTLINLDKADENAYNEVSRLGIDKSDDKRSDMAVIDDMIINVANWLIGGRGANTAKSMLVDSGMTGESAAAIITEIDKVLKEKDVC